MPDETEEPDTALGWAPPVAPAGEPLGDWQPPLGTDAGPPGQPAGWWRRAGAAIFDGLVVGAVGVILAVVLEDLLGASDDLGTAIAAFFGILIGCFYYGNLMSREGEHNGRTWGMQLTEIRVVRIDGQPFTFGFALVREILVKQILFGYLAAFTLYIAAVLNYLWPLWDSKNRALHDHIVKTLVRSAD